MNDNRPILAECPLFVCAFCRTKTGWPHQSWCRASEAADCRNCAYRGRADGVCGHPELKRKERTRR